MTKRILQSGFTLVEVLVSLGIFAVLTGVVLSNYRGYNTNALFSNASEDIVLALRQAQVYGVGVRKGTGGSFTTPYGVYFETANPNQIKIFEDVDSSDTYSVGDSDIEIIKWPSTIGIATSNGLLCDSSPVASLAVTFTRPNPDASIYGNGALCAATGKISITNGIKNASVEITSAGQISLQ